MPVRKSVKASKGLQSSPVFKLGKAAAKRDPRNLQLKAVMVASAVKVPASHDVDEKLPDMPTPVFGNDRVGCCVIAGRAHQMLRFEWVEQKKVIAITEAEVVDEYFRQSDGIDQGLITLDSLRLWRKEGWIAAKRRYFIRAFAEVDRANRQEVKRALVLNLGVGIGLRLPKSAQVEFRAGQPWAKISGVGTTPNSWGGHYVYVTGYNRSGLTCITWGRKHQMTWAFFSRYCDEAYSVIDAINTRARRKALKADRIDRFLATVSPTKAPAKRSGSESGAATVRKRARSATR